MDNKSNSGYELLWTRQEFNLMINNNVCGGCQTCNDKIMYFNFKLPNGWYFLFIREDGTLKIEKVNISVPNHIWENDWTPKIVEPKIREKILSLISHLPENNELWKQIKEICQIAYKFSGDIYKFKDWLFDKRLVER